jgi:hypothetical protein
MQIKETDKGERQGRETEDNRRSRQRELKYEGR